MIKTVLFIAGAALAMPALAQTTSPDSANPTAKAKDPNRKICEKVEKIGSRLANSKVCMTASQWEELRRSHRHDFESVQRIVNQSPSN